MAKSQANPPILNEAEWEQIGGSWFYAHLDETALKAEAERQEEANKICRICPATPVRPWAHLMMTSKPKPLPIAA